MTLEQYAYLAEIIGVILIIASLVYVAQQLRQNTDLLAAQARFNLIERRSSVTARVDQYDLEAMHKYTAGEAVTPAERSAIYGRALMVIEMWEWQYSEYRAGMLPLSELPVGSWGVWYRGEGIWPLPIREVWERQKNVLNSDFVQFLEESVVK